MSIKNLCFMFFNFQIRFFTQLINWSVNYFIITGFDPFLEILDSIKLNYNFAFFKFIHFIHFTKIN